MSGQLAPSPVAYENSRVIPATSGAALLAVISALMVVHPAAGDWFRAMARELADNALR